MINKRPSVNVDKRYHPMKLKSRQNKRHLFPFIDLAHVLGGCRRSLIALLVRGGL